MIWSDFFFVIKKTCNKTRHSRWHTRQPAKLNIRGHNTLIQIIIHVHAICDISSLLRSQKYLYRVKEIVSGRNLNTW